MPDHELIAHLITASWVVTLFGATISLCILFGGR